MLKLLTSTEAAKELGLKQREFLGILEASEWGTLGRLPVKAVRLYKRDYYNFEELLQLKQRLNSLRCFVAETTEEVAQDLAGNRCKLYAVCSWGSDKQGFISHLKSDHILWRGKNAFSLWEVYAPYSDVLQLRKELKLDTKSYVGLTFSHIYKDWMKQPEV